MYCERGQGVYQPGNKELPGDLNRAREVRKCQNASRSLEKLEILTCCSILVTVLNAVFPLRMSGTSLSRQVRTKQRQTVVEAEGVNKIVLCLLAVHCTSLSGFGCKKKLHFAVMVRELGLVDTSGVSGITCSHSKEGPI